MKKFILLCCICAAVFYFYANKPAEQAVIELPSLHSKNALLLNEKAEVLYEKKCRCHYLSSFANEDNDGNRSY